MTSVALDRLFQDARQRLSVKRSIWIKLDPQGKEYDEALVEALEWAIPKGHQLYELFLDNPSLWRLPILSGAPEECHEILRGAIALAMEPDVSAWMKNNRTSLPNLRLIK